MTHAVVQVPVYDGAGVVSAHATIDAEDVLRVLGHRWRWHRAGYVVSAWKERSTIRTLLLHRAVMGLEQADPRHVDHINGDKLDNRRANLRLVSIAENNQNLSSRGGTSRFRGVCLNKKTGRWIAQAGLNGEHYYLGSFESEIEAARVAQEWREENMPFAQPDAALVALEGAAA